MRQCIFCKNKKVTREHVLSSWLFKTEKNIGYIEPAGYVTPVQDNFAIQKFEEKIFERPKIKNNNFVCKCVCEKCNNGWMSQLESKARLFVFSSEWGEKEPNVESYEPMTILRWMMLKFLIFCYSVGFEKAIDNSVAGKVFRGDKVGNVHLDYYLGSHYSVDFSLTQAIPSPIVDEVTKQKILGNTMVFNAQLGKLYLRLMIANFPWKNSLILTRYKTKTIVSDYKTTFQFGDSNSGANVGAKEEFVLFCNSVVIQPDPA